MSTCGKSTVHAENPKMRNVNIQIYFVMSRLGHRRKLIVLREVL